MYGISKFDAKWCIEYQMEGGVINVIGIKLMEVKLMGIEGENFLHVDFFCIFVGIKTDILCCFKKTY